MSTVNTVSPGPNPQKEESVINNVPKISEENSSEKPLIKAPLPSTIPSKPMQVPAIASDFITPPTYSRDVALVTPDSEQLVAPIRGPPVHRRIATKSRSNILRECAIVTPDQSKPSPSSTRPNTRTVPLTKTSLNNLAPSPASRSFTREFMDSSASIAGASGNNYEIFIGDISFFCQEMQLFELFRPFGQVVKQRIRRSDKDGRTLMYGFVEMPVLEEAEKAVKALHGSRFQGRDIRVEISKSKAERIEMQQHQQQPKLRTKTTDFQVHVTFISHFPHNEIVKPKEDLLREIFEEYGKVKDIAIKEYVMNKDSNSQEGFFFVSFTELDEANRVVDMVDRTTIRGFTFRCSLSYNNGGEESFHRIDSNSSYYGSTARGSSNISPAPNMSDIKPEQSTPRQRSAVQNNDTTAAVATQLNVDSTISIDQQQVGHGGNPSGSNHDNSISQVPLRSEAQMVAQSAPIPTGSSSMAHFVVSSSSGKSVPESPGRSAGQNPGGNPPTMASATSQHQQQSQKHGYIQYEHGIYNSQHTTSGPSQSGHISTNASTSSSSSSVSYTQIQAQQPPGPVMIIPLPYSGGYTGPVSHQAPQQHQHHTRQSIHDAHQHRHNVSSSTPAPLPPPVNHHVNHANVPPTLSSTTGYYYLPSHQQQAPSTISYNMPMISQPQPGSLANASMHIPPIQPNIGSNGLPQSQGNLHSHQLSHSHLHMPSNQQQIMYPYANPNLNPPHTSYPSYEYSRLSAHPTHLNHHTHSHPISVPQAPTSQMTYYTTPSASTSSSQHHHLPPPRPLQQHHHPLYSHPPVATAISNPSNGYMMYNSHHPYTHQNPHPYYPSGPESDRGDVTRRYH